MTNSRGMSLTQFLEASSIAHPVRGHHVIQWFSSVVCWSVGYGMGMFRSFPSIANVTIMLQIKRLNDFRQATDSRIQKI